MYVRMLQYPHNVPQNRDHMHSDGSAVADLAPEAASVEQPEAEPAPSTPVDWIPDELLANDPGAVSDHTPPPLFTTLLPNVPHWYINMIDKYYEGDIPDAWLAMLLDDPEYLVMEGLPDHGEIN